MDKIAAIRDIWDLFAAKLRLYYETSTSVTIDEQFYSYRGYAPGRDLHGSVMLKNRYALKTFLYSEKEES